MRSFLLLVATIFVAIGIGVGVVDAVSSTTTPADAVLTAATNTAQTGSAEIAATLSVSGLPGGTTVGGTGSGVTDFATGAMQLDFSYSGSQALAGLSLNEVYVGGDFYLQIPRLAALVPGISWIEVPLGQVAATTNGVGSNPAAVLGLLKQRGNVVTPLGPSVVDGKNVEGYSVAINRAAMLKSLSRLKGAQIPSSLRRAALSVVNSGIHLSVDVYVDQSNQLAQISERVSFPLAAAPQAEATVVMDFNDLGTPATITAPTTGIVTFSQFLKLAKGSVHI